MSLYVQQGNTVYLRIIPLIDEKEYTLIEGDKVIFTVRRGARDDPVIRKVLILEDYNANNELPPRILPSPKYHNAEHTVYKNKVWCVRIWLAL